MNPSLQQRDIDAEATVLLLLAVSIISVHEHTAHMTTRRTFLWYQGLGYMLDVMMWGRLLKAALEAR